MQVVAPGRSDTYYHHLVAPPKKREAKERAVLVGDEGGQSDLDNPRADGEDEDNDA